MNNNFVGRTNLKRNFSKTSVITAVFDFVVYGGTFGVEYLMGKGLDIWVSSNSEILEIFLRWILNNPAPFTIIIFFISLLMLMLYDYKKSTELEAKSAVTGSTSYMTQSHTGNGDNVAGDKFSGDKVYGDKIVVKKDNKPKLSGVNFYPRWRCRKLTVKNGSLEQVITCLKNGIGAAFWNWHDDSVWYQVDSTRTEFYDPKTHDVAIHGFVVHGVKNDIAIIEGGIIKKIIESEEKIANMFTIAIEPAGFKQKVKIHIRLDSDYDYAIPFFDDVQKALENKFGNNNVNLQP